MRKWIGDLQNSDHHVIWKNLLDVLRTDNSAQNIWANEWDHDICRFILGVLISEDQSKNRTDKRQSRQAVNNAIKRELTCPTETGNSSRSKTFRDLFREKCAAAGIIVPPLSKQQQKNLPRLPPAKSSKVRTSETPPVASTPTAQWPNLRTEPSLTTELRAPLTGVDAWTERPLSSEVERFETYRAACGVDEWGRTAWWKVSDNQDIQMLPKLLAVYRLFELRTLLLDFRWIMRTFRCADFQMGMRQPIIKGYDAMLDLIRRNRKKFPAVEVESFRLIRNALVLIIPILARDEGADPTDKTGIAHLATQLVGRLLNLKRRFPNIAYLIQSIEAHAPKPWLRPLTPCFQEPSTDIEIAVPSNGTFTPHLISLSQDGKLLAVSGSQEVRNFVIQSTNKEKETADTKVSSKSIARSVGSRKDSSIQIWEVDSGKCVCTVNEIRSLVRCLALAWDGSCVVAETVDGLFFWQLEKEGDGYLLLTRVDAVSPPKSVTSITPAVERHSVLTTSRSVSDPVITLWDTRTGRPVRRFDSVFSRATCLDVSMYPGYFASGHKNGFIHLWNVWSNDPSTEYCEPVLSFKNEGEEAENGQQHVVLSKVNSTKDQAKTATVSVSFYDKGEDSSWLAAVAANDIIRVWELPPRSITRKSKTFVSTLRRVVIRCQGVRDVQWLYTPTTSTNEDLKDGWFISSGDDGIARLWRKGKNGNWEPHAIGRSKRGRPSDVSTVLVSCGKQTKLVATYVTKSPYVTVWNTSAFEGEDCEIMERAKLYKPYFCMVEESVDATDIRHLTTLKRVRRTDERGGTTTISTNNEEGHGGGSKGMTEYGYGDNVTLIREELELNFSKLGLKNAAKVLGEMHPRLSMLPTENSKPLEICFEQPVIHGVLGTFKTAKAASRAAVAHMHDVENEKGLQKGESNSLEDDETSGMVVALLNGEIAIFELQNGVGGECGTKNELVIEGSITGESDGTKFFQDKGKDGDAGVGGGNGSMIGKGATEGGGYGSNAMENEKNGHETDGTGMVIE